MCFRHMRSLIAASTVLAAAVVAQADLVHRYSFNDGTANDSIGTANGTLVTGATPGNAFIAGGGLDLNQTNANANDDYVALPTSATASLTGAFTIELWAKEPSGVDNYSSFFSFANDQNNFLLFNPRRFGGVGLLTAAVKQSPNGEYDVYHYNNGSGPGFPSSGEHEAAITYDPAANGGQGLLTTYLDGQMVDSGTGGSIAGFNLAAVSNATASDGVTGLFDAIGGNGPFGDTTFAGSIDEFRLYDTALAAADLAANTVAGPDVLVPEPAAGGMLVLLATGLLTLRRRTIT